MPDIEQVQSAMRARMPEVIADLRAKAAEHVPGAPLREVGNRVQNATGANGDTAVIRIYDEVWFLGITAELIAAELEAVTAPKIRVEINSPGGDVWDGIAIYNALRLHPAEVTTRVDGMAASIASIIAQAGDHRIMTSGSQMMIHRAFGLTVGNTKDHADMAAVLEHHDGVLAGIYASRSGGEADKFLSLMDAETWLTADDTVAEGLADEVVDPPRKEAQARGVVLIGGTTIKPAQTLHDEISGAVDAVSGAVTSAERVAALRAEAGKNLSDVNREGLVGLRDALGRLDGLLTPQADSDEPLANEYARFVALTQGVTS